MRSIGHQLGSDQLDQIGSDRIKPVKKASTQIKSQQIGLNYIKLG